LLDGSTDARISAAAADIAGHGRINIAVAWIGIACQQARGGHDLPRLAIAALRHLQIDPGLLNGFARGGVADGLDRCDRRRPDAIHSGEAGARWLPVKMHSARTALADAAAEFGAGYTKDVAQDPKQGNIAIDIHNPVLAVDFDLVGHLGNFQLDA
jgi:hypothetical protein